MATVADVERLDPTTIQSFSIEQFAGLILTIYQNPKSGRHWTHTEVFERGNLLGIPLAALLRWTESNNPMGAPGAGGYEISGRGIYKSEVADKMDDALRFLTRHGLIEPDPKQGQTFVRLTPMGEKSGVDSFSFSIEAIERNAQEIDELYSTAVYLIEITRPDGTKATGTAFRIGERRLLSCGHNFEGEGRFDIWQISQNMKWESHLFKIKPITGQDLAVIDFEQNARPLIGPLLKGAPKAHRGQSVILLGHPPIPTISEATLVNRTIQVAALGSDYFEAEKKIIFGEAVQGGFSGSPILDSHGRLCGVLTSRTELELEDKNKPQNMFSRAVSGDTALAAAATL